MDHVEYEHIKIILRWLEVLLACLMLMEGSKKGCRGIPERSKHHV